MTRFLICFLVFATAFQVASAQIRLGLQQFTRARAGVVDIAHCGDSRLFFVQQAGTIQVMNIGDTVLRTNFLDIQSRISSGGERGLLGLAFHPRFLENGYFYVNYTNKQGHTHISRFSVDPNNKHQALANSEDTLLVVNQPYSNHNGGCIKFGKDGYLYIGMGDGGAGGDPQNVSQNPKSLLGKMLRIDVDTREGNKKFGIPASNPFVGNSNYAPEIWAVGVRNPWRFSFDAETNDLWMGDVGQDKWEEVNYVPASSKGGENYGWNCYEGVATYRQSQCSFVNVHTAPIWVYEHKQPYGESVNGGYVYRGFRFPGLKGTYVFGDFEYGSIFTIHKADTGWVPTVRKVSGTKANAFASFGEDADNEMYYADATNGMIYSVVDSTCLGVEVSASSPFTTTTKGSSPFELTASPTGGRFIGKGVDGNFFNPALADTGANYIRYVYNNQNGCGARAFVKITVTASTNSVDENSQGNSIQIYPNPTKGELKIISQREGLASIWNYLGEKVHDVWLRNGVNTLSTEELPQASYFILMQNVVVPFIKF